MFGIVCVSVISIQHIRAEAECSAAASSADKIESKINLSPRIFIAFARKID